jgi:hypothetical protein
MVEFVPMRIQARFNVPQTFATRNLGVCQTKELIEGGKGFGPMFASISTNAKIKVMPGEKLKQLPENVLAGIHGHPPKVLERIPPSKFKSKTKKYVKEH